MPNRKQLRHVTFELSDEVRRALKAGSIRSGRSMSAITREALRLYLANSPRDTKNKEPDGAETYRRGVKTST